MVLGRPLFPPFHGRSALCNIIKAKGQMKILLPSSDHLGSSGTFLGLCKAQKGSHLVVLVTELWLSSILVAEALPNCDPIVKVKTTLRTVDINGNEYT
ncbi:hypothetical protein SLA2020_147250 [Shorea laevis]